MTFETFKLWLTLECVQPKENIRLSLIHHLWSCIFLALLYSNFMFLKASSPHFWLCKWALHLIICTFFLTTSDFSIIFSKNFQNKMSCVVILNDNILACKLLNNANLYVCYQVKCVLPRLIFFRFLFFSDCFCPCRVSKGTLKLLSKKQNYLTKS